MVWIVNYESANHIVACLSSLSGSAVDEIFILDNSSSEADRAKLARIEDANTTVFYSSTNLGFGGGHNEIARRVPPAHDDIVWLLNPDTIVPEDTPALLVAVIESGEAEIVSPLIESRRDDVNRIWFSGGRIDIRRGHVEDSQLGRDPVAVSQAQRLLNTEFITGAAPMMRRGTWDTLGGFREDLFLYWEDVELSLRAQERGFSMAVLTTAKIFHLEGGSSVGVRSTRSRAYFYMSRNRILVCRRPFSRGFSLVLGPGTIGLARFAGHAMFREGGGRGARALAIARGAVEALRTE